MAAIFSRGSRVRSQSQKVTRECGIVAQARAETLGVARAGSSKSGKGSGGTPLTSFGGAIPFSTGAQNIRPLFASATTNALASRSAEHRRRHALGEVPGGGRNAEIGPPHCAAPCRVCGDLARVSRDIGRRTGPPRSTCVATAPVDRFPMQIAHGHDAREPQHRVPGRTHQLMQFDPVCDAGCRTGRRCARMHLWAAFRVRGARARRDPY